MVTRTPHRAHPSAISRRHLIGGAASVGLLGLSACSGSRREEEPDEEGGTRKVEHPLGSSTIPVSPQRIIALDAGGGLQTALECGAPVIAAETLAGETEIPDYLPAPPQDFTPLGFNEVNFEQILSLEPDLIIGSRVRVEEHYAKLTEIAPTVPFLNTADQVEWRETVRTVGELLGGAEAIESRITEFEERAAAFAADHAEVLASTKVALVRFTADEVRVLTGIIFPADVLAACGVQRPPSNEPPAAEDTYISLSPENVSELEDADVIIYFSGGGGFARDASELFTSVTEGGLWRALPAVAEKRAHEVSALSWWDGYSVAGALTCLDDLESILGS